MVWPIKLQCYSILLLLGSHIFLFSILIPFSIWLDICTFLYFFVIISSLGWSFLIPIRYCLKYKVFWLNYYVSIQIRSCITNWKLRFSLLFSIWLLTCRFFVWGRVGVDFVYLWESFLYHYWFIKFNLNCICNIVSLFGFWSLFYIRSICHIKY